MGPEKGSPPEDLIGEGGPCLEPHGALLAMASMEIRLGANVTSVEGE